MKPSDFQAMRDHKTRNDPHPYLPALKPVRCYSELFKEYYTVLHNQLTFDSGVQYLDTEIAKIQGLSDEDLKAIHLAKTQLNGKITQRISLPTLPNWQ